jgi:streptogrisin D
VGVLLGHHQWCAMQPSNSSNFVGNICDNDVYGNWECWQDLVVANGTPSQDGDSGGPVFTLDGTNSVTAKGTVTGSGSGFTAYQDFGTAWMDFNVRPVG